MSTGPGAVAPGMLPGMLCYDARVHPKIVQKVSVPAECGLILVSFRTTAKVTVFARSVK